MTRHYSFLWFRLVLVLCCWWHQLGTTTTTTTFGFVTVEILSALRSNVRSQEAYQGKRPVEISCLNDHVPSYLEDLLAEYGWRDRLVSLSNNTLPLVAEIQRDGKTELGILHRLEFADDQNEKPPKLIVNTPSASAMSEDAIFKIDLGQLTTIWTTDERISNHVLCNLDDDLSQLDPIAFAEIDRILDELYDNARHLIASSKRKGWTKKQLQQKIDQTPTTVSFVEKTLIETVIRQIYKAGPRHDQLIDSIDVASSLPKITFSDDTTRSRRQQLLQRARATMILDESGGGRFKRLPCIPIAWNEGLETMTLINGGWIAVDPAVRAASEARALATTGTSRGTNADERILQRLEYLALTNTDDTIEQEELKLDVREYLKALDLPLNSKGAREALIQMGLWSIDQQRDGGEYKPQPWSSDILQAVEWYQNMDEKRRTRLAQNLRQQTRGGLEGRVDLTHLPSVCIDAARTSFRDDAIGVRPRTSTGRKVSKGSKWEILIHTTDVSDLYSPVVVERSNQLQLLQEAASKRGSSRYDLPSGPLHLLPPALLETLGLDTMRPGNFKPATNLFNRCVTLWLYIDGTTGKLLDAGLERTLISTPLALSFQSATDLIEGDESNLSTPLAKAKALLVVVEREVTMWSEYRQQNSATARAREERLTAREEVDRQIYGDMKGGKHRQRDDGRDGFHRTRGHRLVDTCLDIHGFALNNLLKRAKANVPYVSGNQEEGRTGSAPLRRYIDGMAQRQALSVLCRYGGEPLSKDECTRIGMAATKAINAISNIKSFKTTASLKTSKVGSKQQKQLQAARALAHQLSTRTSSGPFLAMSTGKQSEVVILGVGAVASCKGIKGTLKPGSKLYVAIRQVDPSTGLVKATLVPQKGANRK